ncbi:LuxR C-terminal-related transcriptional regulator [Eggerthellaceae bacterium 3-80]
MNAVYSGITTRLRQFWPMLVGIVCARTALIVACYGSYSSTDDGIFTDGAMLVVCVLLVVLLLIFGRTRSELPSNVVQLLFAISVAVAAGCSIALSLVDNTDQSLLTESFVLSVISTLALSLCMFYWLRSMRGSDEVTAALFVFCAFTVSVILVYIISFAPLRVQNIIGAVMIVAQLVLIGPAEQHRQKLSGRAHSHARTFFTFARNRMQDTRFLAACTVGVATLSFVDGFLRGYPDGLPIAFTPPTRLAYVVITLVVCAFMLILVVRRRERVMTIVYLVVMVSLASISLVLFGAFDQQWEIGASVVNTLNILICAYCFYVIIAFARFGDRDPYVYAMVGWIVCFGSRSIARMLLLYFYPLTGNDLFINSLLSALILFSALVVLIQFISAEQGEYSLDIERNEAEKAEAIAQAQHDIELSNEALEQAQQQLLESARRAADQHSADLEAAYEALMLARAQRCIKCTEGCSPTAPVIQADVPEVVETPQAESEISNLPTSLSDSMRQNVRQMGEHFLLSDREMDVLTLYALGHTQKKVAEELHITPATAHTHIKRIYGKCGMHSRQEILEYLEAYSE